MADSADTTDKISLLIDTKDEIKHKISMIQSCRGMIEIANKLANRFPSISELAADVVQGNRELITRYTVEIRSIQSGKSKVR